MGAPGRAAVVAGLGVVATLAPYVLTPAEGGPDAFALVMAVFLGGPFVLVAVAGLSMRAGRAWAVTAPLVVFDAVMLALVATDDSSTAALGYLSTGIIGLVYGIVVLASVALVAHRGRPTTP